jgi:hypothetical protein
MSHWLDDTLAVAVTVMPPAVAEADAGPNVVGPCSASQHVVVLIRPAQRLYRIPGGSAG